MSVYTKTNGGIVEVPQGSVALKDNSSIKSASQIWVKKGGVWLPIWNYTAHSSPTVFWGTAQFSDTDFTGGKQDPNLAGDPYENWTGVQDFIDSELTNVVSNPQDGMTFSTFVEFPDFCYFAHPLSMGLATFFDNDSGFTGGWDGIRWPDDGGIHNETGPMRVTYDDGTGPTYWLVYRTDMAGIKDMSWSVTFSLGG